ncbi:uncharacterized protein LOC124690424 [Lolium rigidum]|uniref:uncharacterized protein LOC124690424 n=1 Tax=Lolium rigidum TaxID=89674 RepID=UPI001F5CBAFA|nr:uncharacterized protein LOC124690424 [Lolium rigidum]
MAKSTGPKSPWERPAPRQIKVNVDGSFYLEEYAGSVAAVLRDTFGNFVAASTIYMPTVASASMTEALAMREGLALANRLGYNNVLMESDSTDVVEACRGDEAWWGEVSAVFADCVDLVSLIGCVNLARTQLRIDSDNTMRTEMMIRMEASSEKGQYSKAMKIAAAIDGVESVTVSGEGRSLLQVVGEGVDSNDLISKLRRKVGHADIVELHTLQGGRGYASSSATGSSGGYHSVHDGARSDSATYGQYSNHQGPSYSPVAADPYYYRHQQPSYEYYSPPPYPATVVLQEYPTGEAPGCSIM